jgi:Zn-dependent metalloprotease
VLLSKPTRVTPSPAVVVYNCNHQTSLPGTPVSNARVSKDTSAKRAYIEASGVADFYQTAFGRNSVDDAGKTLL